MKRKRSASRKLAETTQKHFLPMISASGDKAGILTPPSPPSLQASFLGPVSILQLWTEEGGSCLDGASAVDTKGWGKFELEGHDSAMDPFWTIVFGVF